MKNVLLLTMVLSLLMFNLSCKDNTKERKLDSNQVSTVITGQIKNSRNPLIVFHYNTKSDTIKLKSDGSFSASLDITNPSYVKIQLGFQETLAFVFPGDNVNLTSDNTDFNSTLKYTGDNSDINDFLNEQYLIFKNTAINSADFMYSSQIDRFLNSLNTLKNSLNNNYTKFKNAGKAHDQDFLELEQKRIEFKTLSLIINYFMALRNSNTPDMSILKAEMDVLVAGVNADNKEYLTIFEYKELLPQYISLHFVKKIEDDNIAAVSYEDIANIYFEIIEDRIKTKEVLAELYYVFLDDLFSNYGVVGLGKHFERYKTLNPDNNRLHKLQSIYTVWAQLAPGSYSVNFEFPDINGKMYSLKDFSGKYVYIDVWASWCGPCKVEIPYLKQLKNDFKGKNIEIIAISVDEKRADWENFIRSNNMGGIQLFAGGWNNSLVQHFRITGIPRFILLDKEGRIINANAERPSGNIASILNSLDGI